MAAAALVSPGMRLGLGSGSTFLRFLVHLANRIQGEGLDVVGVPTSEGTAQAARDLGVPLTTLDEVPSLHLAIDGADEVDRQKNLVKGGGGALVREKIVAAAADEMIVMVSESKWVDRLGISFPLPVEVIPFGWGNAARRLRELGAEPRLRGGIDTPFVTDNGNFILDCVFASGIEDPMDLERSINTIPGVLDNGLFAGMAGRILTADADGHVRETV